MNLQWINSTGGSIVCASPATAKVWRGTQGSSVAELRSDYERACDELDYVNVIASGSHQALVLGDEPMQSAFVAGEGCVFIVRWIACLSNDRAEQVLARIPQTLPLVEESKKISLDDEGLVMFDAALSSLDPAVLAAVKVEPGAFTVTTEMYKVKEDYEFLIHRFLRDRKP